MDNLLETYDKEVRAKPIYPEILKVVKENNLVKLVGPGSFNFISYWNIPDDYSLEQFHHQIEVLKSDGGQIMWRVFDHDKPENLEINLEREGFKYIDSLTLMVLQVQGYTIAGVEEDIREISDKNGLQDFLAVSKKSFGHANPLDLESHLKLIQYPNFKYYVGYSRNSPVAAARLEVPVNSQFGLLFGGCVIPEYREKGYYKALLNARLKAAKSIGLKYITTEARKTSRPILEHVGFTPLVKGKTWHYVAND
tara:strand:+ start:8570 stop:9325 length:756 start_codon:yes stop_codon:yes gene_type:complete